MCRSCLTAYDYVSLNIAVEKAKAKIKANW